MSDTKESRCVLCSAKKPSSLLSPSPSSSSSSSLSNCMSCPRLVQCTTQHSPYIMQKRFENVFLSHSKTQNAIVQIIPISSALTLFIRFICVLRGAYAIKKAILFSFTLQHISLCQVFNLKKYMAVIFQYFALFKELFLM